MKSIEEWRGPRDPVALDPATVIYRVAPAASKKAGSNASCKGCAFERQESRVCIAASSRAVAAGLPDCDAGWIYVLPDPRQTDCAAT
jgi:hypothetical protein